MNSPGGPVWVIAEQVKGHVADVSLELVGQAGRLAHQLGALVEVVLLGHRLGDQVKRLFFAGADVIYLGDSPAFLHYQPEVYAETIVSLARRAEPQIVLIGSTFAGRELAPLIASGLETGLTAHSTDMVLNADQVLEQRIPAYGGMMSIVCPVRRPQMATVARGVFPVPRLDHTRSGRVIPVEPPQDVRVRVQTLEIVASETEGVPLESAPIIVAGGAGAGTLEGWKEIEALAEALGAAVGSTRPAVDAGWTELETMIGQSGKVARPEFYMAIGLSGEQQHMVGITGAKVMVAINNDPKAPVFDQVDYGIVEDCRKFVPVLAEKIREYRNR